MSDKQKELKEELSTEQILSADVAELTPQQMQTRIQILTVLEAQVKLEIAEAQNREFQDKKEERIRQARNKSVILQEEQDRIAREQTGCAHKSGGKGVAGFFQGDGKMGRVVAEQRLPDGATYFLCFRCQREWWLPNKRDVLEGRMTLAQYRAKEKEFYEVKSWERPLFSTDSGEIPGSVQFKIPRLEAQKAKDDAEFAEYLQRQGARA